VQTFLSWQGVPLGLTAPEHTPVAGLQVPASRHRVAVQTTRSAPLQVPARQVSERVQALPSSQAEPSGLIAPVEQVPVAGLQTPSAWHWSPEAQATGFAPVQLPAWQVSERVQALPSLQAEPSGLAAPLEQVPVAGLQTPAS
jgi:hypothetical protein